MAKVAPAWTMTQITPQIVSASSGSNHDGDPAAIQSPAVKALLALPLPGGFVRAGSRAVVKPQRGREHNELRPDPRTCGLIATGSPPVAGGGVAAARTGFNRKEPRWLKNRCVRRVMSFVPFQPDEIQVVSNRAEHAGKLAQKSPMAPAS